MHLVVDVLMDANGQRQDAPIFICCILPAGGDGETRGKFQSAGIDGDQRRRAGTGGAWLCAAVWIFRACSKFIFGRNDLGRNTARRIFIYLR